MIGIVTLTNVKAALTGRKEFASYKTTHSITINNTKFLGDSFQGLRTECKGIIFDLQGKCISRPFPAFSHIGSRKEWKKLRHEPVDVYEKIDGYLVQCYIHPDRDELMCSTRSSFSTIPAKTAQALIYENSHLFNQVRKVCKKGWTPLFSVVSPQFPLTIFYKRPMLFYLASRHIVNGNYYYHKELGDRYGVTKYDMSLNEASNYFQDKPYCKGVVCYLKSQVVDFETAWYRRRHAVLMQLQRPRHELYKAALQGKLDFFLKNAPDTYRAAVNEVALEVRIELKKKQKRLARLYDDLYKLSALRSGHFRMPMKDIFEGLLIKEEMEIPLRDLFAERDPTDSLARLMHAEFVRRNSPAIADLPVA